MFKESRITSLRPLRKSLRLCVKKVSKDEQESVETKGYL